MNQTRYTIPDSVAWVVDDSGAERLVYLASMVDLSAIVLDGSAALIWELACEMPHAEVAAAVSEATGEAVCSVTRDVDDFIADLIDRKLLEPQEVS